LAGITVGRAFCDVIEIPSGADRILPTNHPAVVTRYQDAAYAEMLRQCDGLITVGHTLGAELEKYGVPVHVIPNYRPYEHTQATDVLRQRCRLGDGDRLVLCMSTIASGLETVLQAMSALPSNVHLAVMGRKIPESYEKEIRELVGQLDLEERVHYFGPVPYNDLTSNPGLRRMV
jgi:glycosyltransferase involved in cell wall biosynthesis